MGKLFLFGIGGTGSRVLKSLAFLLASGVKLKDCSEIVPIIVDPHQSNKDLARTTDILNLYENIRKELGENNDKFFNAKITPLSSLKKDDSLSESYTFNLENVSGTKFKHFIDYDSLDKSNKALVDLLFSKENLEGVMDIGFVGNPHIGSVVLNQFKDSDEFKTFANHFNKGDRVFIISSIFGGTGASGFPIILKNIRNASKNTKLSSTDYLENAPIGALSVMPYFNIDHKDDSVIQKSEWIQKTKAALSYYERNVTGNNSVNAMYYLGDTLAKAYENDPGERGQKNDAHLVEFIGALSIIDFINLPDARLETISGKAKKPIAKEYGLKEDIQSVNFSHIGNNTERLVGKNMAQFALFYKFITHHFKPNGPVQPYQLAGDQKLDSLFFDTLFFRDYILNFFKFYKDWITENKNNLRAFNPLELDNAFSQTIVGIDAKSKGFIRKTKFGFNEVVRTLNKTSEGEGYDSKAIKFINLFYDAMDSVIDENYDRFKK